MKNKFKVGDRVKAYNGTGSYRGVVHSLCDNKDVLLIIVGVNDYIKVHYKQCRRLVKKKPKVYWVVENYLFYSENKAKDIYPASKIVKVKVVKEGK